MTSLVDSSGLKQLMAQIGTKNHSSKNQFRFPAW